jgi:hypothetical protein
MGGNRPRSRRGRGVPVRTVMAAVLVFGGVLSATVTACSDDDDGDEGGGDTDEVGALETVAEDPELSSAVDLTAGGDGVWVALEDGQVLTAPAAGAGGDGGLEPVAGLDAVSTNAGIAAGGDGTLFATDDDRRQLLRLRDGAVEPAPVPAVQELSELAAGPDGTVYIGDYMGLQLVSLSPDGRLSELDTDVQAGPIAVGPDGTVFFVEDQLFDGRIMVLPAGGEPRELTLEVERGDGGNPVEQPSDGAAAGESYIEALDLAATADGLYVLSSGSEVWRIGEDERLELVLRQGGDVALAALAAAGDDVYVLDSGSGTISTLA